MKLTKYIFFTFFVATTGLNASAAIHLVNLHFLAGNCTCGVTKRYDHVMNDLATSLTFRAETASNHYDLVHWSYFNF